MVEVRLKSCGKDAGERVVNTRETGQVEAAEYSGQVDFQVQVNGM